MVSNNRKRRGRGEGSISGPRKDGLFVVAFSLGIVDGKRQRKSLYANSRQEALEILRKGPGQNIPLEDLTVFDYLSGWLSARVDGLAENTEYLYERRLTKHVYPGLGTVKLTTLRPQDLRLWLGKLKKEGVSEIGRAGALGTLSAGLEQAVRDGVIQVNPVNQLDRAEKPSTASKDMKIWSKADIRKFIEAESLVMREGWRMKSWYYAGAALGLFGGLRLGEVLGLKWSNIDFRSGKYGSINIELQLLQVRGRVIGLRPPKTKRSRRIISMTPTLRGILLRLRERQMAKGRAAQEMLFMSESGEHPEQNKVRAVFYSICKKVGLPKIRFHDLRHTHASHLLNSGAPIKAAAQRLGHSVQMLMVRYAHVIEGADEELAGQFEQGLVEADGGDLNESGIRSIDGTESKT